MTLLLSARRTQQHFALLFRLIDRCMREFSIPWQGSQVHAAAELGLCIRVKSATASRQPASRSIQFIAVAVRMYEMYIIRSL